MISRGYFNYPTLFTYVLGLLICFLNIMPVKAATSGTAMITPHGQTVQLMPFLDYYIDESLSDDIEEIAVLGQTNAFHPFSPGNLPPEEGITWLRFILAPKHPDLKSGTYLLDMGQSIPGKPALYSPVRNELSGAMEWRESIPTRRNILLMPEAGAEPLICYLRIEGLPGPWFDPVIRSPQDAATNWGSLFHTGAVLALAIVMLLCLLRGMNENGQWRIWTALFVGLALTQSILGMPAVSQSFSVKKLAAILAPGLALMMIPHVGRHLMRTFQHSRLLDIQLITFSLVGAGIALLPLFPGCAWLDRWLELWPACMILFVPTAIAAWISGLAGARPFLSACLIAPLFTAIGWFGIDFGLPANLLAAAPLCGIVLSALILVTAKLPVHEAASTREKSKKKGPKAFKILPDANEEIINLDNPLNDPNLRIITAPVQEIPEKTIPANEKELLNNQEKNISDKETAIRLELDNLLRESAGLGKCALPAASRVHAEKMIASAENMAKIMSGDSSLPEEETSQIIENFNLQRLVREVHDCIAPIAEHAGLSLSWYMPPFLEQEYQGNARQLSQIIKMLLDSAIRGTDSGQVKLSIRRVPESADPGHLIFTISDTGNGAPPLNRSTVALARTWELAARHNGFMGMESGPDGLSIAFSVHLKVNNEADSSNQVHATRLIISGTNAASRHKLAKIIEEIPLTVSETSTIAEAMAIQRSTPVNLLVTLDTQAKPTSGDLIRNFVDEGKKHGFKAVYILAITPDESQWNLLKSSGFTHAMLEPVEAETLKYTISQLLEPQANEEEENSQEKKQASQQNNLHKSEDENNIIGLMDTFYTKTTHLLEKKQDYSAREQTEISAEQLPQKENSPQMLVEQQLEIINTFEGPDWLVKNPKVKQQAENAVQDDAVSPDKIQGENTDNHEKNTEKDFQQLQSASMEQISHTGNNAENIPDSQSVSKTVEHSSSQSDYFEEWVGEPMPITKSNKNAEATLTENETVNNINIPEQAKSIKDEDKTVQEKLSRADNSPAESVMDFIISVNQETNSDNIKTEVVPEIRSGNDNSEMSDSKKPRSQDPIINAFLDKLDEGLRTAQSAYANGNCQKVEEATALMSQQAESFSCRILARLASCVQRAAKAKDLKALGDLLPVLADAVERNRIASSSKID